MAKALNDKLTQKERIYMADKQSREAELKGFNTIERAVEKAERRHAVKIDVDVSDALTGLKAVQREAKKATQALREVEAATYESRKQAAQDAINVQGADGNWDYDAYMHGMYNGMALIHAIYGDVEPEFRDAPDEFIAGKPKDTRKPVSE